jgi:hypothetical protein
MDIVVTLKRVPDPIPPVTNGYDANALGRRFD